MAEIRVQSLKKQFGSFVAVKESTFTVADGEFFVMLGPSGCGKTTTLRMIAGLELPTSGSITLGGDDVTFKRASERDIAFVFQLFALYPHMNVRQNIAYPLKNQGTPRAEIKSRVEETARILRISHLLDRSVSGLSSGDRQRVALGRAIVRRPKAFMMDEPLGALDTEMREVMIHELRALHDRMGATTVYVTHDQLEAMAMADKIVVMNHGVVEQFGTPQEIYDKPATLFVADFIGSPAMNFLRFHGKAPRGASVITLGDRAIAMPALRADVPESSLVLGVRPEHVQLADDGDIRAKALGSEYLGTTQIVWLETPYGPVKARIASDRTVRRGETVALSLHPDRLSLFDAKSGRALPTALNAISRRFGDTQAVDDLTLTVGDGEFVVLLGPTGAGKTTTLRLIAGIEKADKGSIFIGGRDVSRASPAERDVTFVFQQYSLYPHLSVYDNLAFPLRSPARRVPEPEIRTRVTAVAEMLRIAGKLQNRATKLSGGEMQRVAIGRALVRTPQVYLMDEPLSSLDAKLRSDLRLELKRIQQDLGATILYVTHDQIEAMTMATRIGVMSEGRIVQFGTPRQIYEDPDDTYVATRLGIPRINLLPAGLIAAGAVPAGATQMGLRTEHLEIAKADGDANAEVVRLEPLGDQTHLHLTIDGHPMTTLVDPHSTLKKGDRVRLSPKAPLYFGADGRRIRH